MTEPLFSDIIRSENNFSDAILRGIRRVDEAILKGNVRIFRFLTSNQTERLEKIGQEIDDITTELERRKWERKHANNN